MGKKSKKKKFKKEQEKIVEEPKKKPYLKLGLCGSAALLAVLGGYGVYNVASKKETKSSQAAVSEKDLLDRIREYATVTPARDIDPNKPFCFYIGQRHTSYSKSGDYSRLKGAKSQVMIYRILSALAKGDNLEAVYMEGWKGKFPCETPATSKLTRWINSASDTELTKRLMRNKRGNAMDLLFSATGFDDIYGFSSDNPVEGRRKLELLLNRVDSVSERLRDSRAANWPLRLSFREAIQHKEDLYTLASNVDAVTVDSVENIQSLPGYGRENNIAVVFGSGHIPDLQQMDSEGKLEEIHKRFNIAYVLPHGSTIPSKKEDIRVRSLRDAKVIEDLIKKAKSKNERLVRIY